MLEDYITGIVIQGLQNGRKFGFPTANVRLSNQEETPEEGVYAVKVIWKEHHYFGMLYVGKRPTLHLKTMSIEVHIFDFNEEIYGEALSFKIMKKIRNDRKFESIEALTKQIDKDKDDTLHYFSR